MSFVYFIGLLFLGTSLHGRLKRRIEFLNSELSQVKKELRILQKSQINIPSSSLNPNLKPNPISNLENIQDTYKTALDKAQKPIDYSARYSIEKNTEIRDSVNFSKPEPSQALKVSKPFVQKPLKPLLEKPNEKSKINKDFKAFLKKIENHFSGNLTGVLGTLAVVLGVVFLGVYSAIQLAPIGRFGVICFFSLALLGLHFFLKKRDFWRNIALWVRSASGVLFLIACLGSIGIEPLKWINDPMFGLALLSLGLAINMIFGFLNGGQVFASVHVVFSLIALSLIPFNSVTFSIAALVSFVGILMSVNEKRWDKHLIVTIISFTALHLYGIYSIAVLGVESSINDLQGILLCVIVGTTAVLSHYRKIYTNNESKTKVPLASHMIAWISLGLNLIVYSDNNAVLSTALLSISAFLVFFMSLKAQKLSIKWLYICDRLVSLVLALLAVMSLGKFGLSVLEVSCLLAIVSAIYLGVISKVFESTIFKISSVCVVFLYANLFVQILILVGSSFVPEASEISLIIGAFLILSMIFPSVNEKAKDLNEGFIFKIKAKEFRASFIEIPLAIFGFFTLVLVNNKIENPLFLLIPFAMLIFVLILRSRAKNILLDIITLLSITLCLFDAMNFLLSVPDHLDFKLFLVIGMAIVGCVGIVLSRSEFLKQKVMWPGVFLVWIMLLLSSYCFTKDISPILPGILWLILCLVMAEVKNFFSLKASSGFHDKTDVFIEIFGMVSLLFYFCRFFLIDISNEALVFGSIRLRILSEVFCLGVILYWLSFFKESRNKTVNNIVNCFLELFLLATSVFIILELNSIYLPIIWSVASLVTYYIGKKIPKTNRLIIYSYLYYFLTLFFIAFISTTLVTPSALIIDQAWVMGLIAVCLNIVYMVLVKRDHNIVSTTQFNFNKENEVLIWMQNILEKFEVKILLYPLFASIAFFLYWSFDKTVLSLLWVVECFVLFLISIAMREPQFRVISMLGIGLVFLRIIFYDLTSKDFFIKAIVFISVGVILIAMNTIYNKYKHRYEPK